MSMMPNNNKSPSSLSALAPSPPPPQLYSQKVQLKLYQSFIFSIPILFSIILFLLFYLFYLKRRRSRLPTFSSSTPPFLLPTTAAPNNQQTTTPFIISSTCDTRLKGGELKDILCTVMFDEDLKAKDPICSVCLGEYEMKEELLQVASCKHVFHVDCIRHWLHYYSNSTCPLCRSSVFGSAATPLDHHHHRLPPPMASPPAILVQD